MERKDSTVAKRRKSKNVKSVECLPVIRPNVAGLDLGSREHFVCGPPRTDGVPNVRSFRTVTAELEELATWLEEQGVASVAMESTSVYWIPVYEILEQRGFEVVLVNSRQLKFVPGRKTDVQDCQWIQLLHSCGLLRGSFRPNEAICRLRALKRQSANLVAERTKAIQWMQKALDQMNVQVHHAVSDIVGRTGLAIINAIVDGERDPIKLAELRDHRCRKSVEEIALHLQGNWRTEHLFNLKMALRFFEHLQSTIEDYEEALAREIEALTPDDRKGQKVPPHPIKRKQNLLNRTGIKEGRTIAWRLSGVDLTRIDGVGHETALVFLTEAGLDLSSFPTEKHFASWLRLTPRTAFSAGKPIRKRRNCAGATRLSLVFRLSAVILAKTKTALGAEFRRLSRRKGKAIAVFAMARKLAILCYRMMRHGQEYVDVGEEVYEQRYQERRLKGITASAKELGYDLVPRCVEG